jgi:S1-C subfamily serine protease
MMIGNLDKSSDVRETPLRRLWRRYRTQALGAGLFALGMISVSIALLAYNLFVPHAPQLTINEVNDSIAQTLAAATPAPAFSEQVYKEIIPSIVFIQSRNSGTGREPNVAIGSGVVINTNGEILTSLHVVAEATEIELTYADGSQVSAQIVAKQPENDIAVLSPSRLPRLIVPATLGNPNALQIGDEAYVVGHPLGLTGSMSAGIISGLNRSYEPIDSSQGLNNLIQIDAAVNPGNSGGPLLNRYGQVVGIVTALANPTDQNFFVGIGFAVPITIAGAAVGLPPY